MILLPEELSQILPGIPYSRVSLYIPHLTMYMPKYKIDTPQRIGAFIAQVGEESEDFQFTREIGSGAEYEGNRDLGNNQPGDGPRFKGRGLIQITGRMNYRNASLHMFEDLRLLDHPELLELPQYAVQSACWYWQDRDFNSICDMPETWIKDGVHHYTKFQWITVKVNGGLNGYAQRLANYQRARAVLNF